MYMVIDVVARMKRASNSIRRVMSSSVNQLRGNVHCFAIRNLLWLFCYLEEISRWVVKDREAVSGRFWRTRSSPDFC